MPPLLLKTQWFKKKSKLVLDASLELSSSLIILNMMISQCLQGSITQR
jgi:hypothetical protein